jgi:hypothetical protein
MGIDHLARIAVGLPLGLGDRQVMVGAIEAVGRQCGDGLVRCAHRHRPFDFHHGASRVLLQFHAGRQPDVVRLAVGAIDNQIALVVQLVGQPFADDATDDGTPILARLEHRQLALLAVHGPLHGADDVAAFTHCPQGGFGVGMDSPHAGLRLVRQSYALQTLQAARPSSRNLPGTGAALP